MRYTAEGTAIANFTIATTERFTKNGEKQERTEWHRCSAYKKTAELIGKHLAKGSQVYVEGKLRTRRWEDKQGTERSQTYIEVESVEFLGKAAPTGAAEENAEPPKAIDENDIPF
jgi:single-strand DNA-binding protein